MTTVYVLQVEGVYLHPSLGVFSTTERAEVAKARAEQSSDGYHRLEIVSMELDTWQLGAFAPLMYYLGVSRHLRPAPTDIREGLL